MAEYLQKMGGLFLGQCGLPEPDTNLPPLEHNVITSPDQPESVDSLWSDVQECIGRFNNGQRDLFNRIIGTEEDVSVPHSGTEPTFHQS